MRAEEYIVESSGKVSLMLALRIMDEAIERAPSSRLCLPGHQNVPYRTYGKEWYQAAVDKAGYKLMLPMKIKVGEVDRWVMLAYEKCTVTEKLKVGVTTFNPKGRASGQLRIAASRVACSFAKEKFEQPVGTVMVQTVPLGCPKGTELTLVVGFLRRISEERSPKFVTPIPLGGFNVILTWVKEWCIEMVQKENINKMESEAMDKENVVDDKEKEDGMGSVEWTDNREFDRFLSKILECKDFKSEYSMKLNCLKEWITKNGAAGASFCSNVKMAIRATSNLWEATESWEWDKDDKNYVLRTLTRNLETDDADLWEKISKIDPVYTRKLIHVPWLGRRVKRLLKAGSLRAKVGQKRTRRIRDRTLTVRREKRNTWYSCQAGRIVSNPPRDNHALMSVPEMTIPGSYVTTALPSFNEIHCEEFVGLASPNLGYYTG